MAELVTPGSAGLGQFTLDTATGAVRFNPQSAAGWPTGVTETRATVAVRDAAGAYAFAQVAVNVTRAAATEDADAAAYLDAVEAADGAALEPAYRAAVNKLVVDVKADGTWGALAACCILAGARTLAGALVPLRGTAPSNGGFVAGDYSRTSGLKGNRAKFINTNRGDNVDAQNNFHASVWVTEPETNGGVYIGTLGNSSQGSLTFARFSAGASLTIRDRCLVDNSVLFGDAAAPGLIGMSRTSSNSSSLIVAGEVGASSLASAPASGLSINIFRRNAQNSSFFTPTDARLAWYSLGPSVNLPQLNARLGIFFNDVGEALA